MRQNNILLLAVALLTLTGNGQSAQAQVQTSEPLDSNKTSAAIPANTTGAAEPFSPGAKKTVSEASPSTSESKASSKRAKLRLPKHSLDELSLIKIIDNTAPEAQQQPAAADTADLAKKLSNPVASLISFPIQTNFDFGMGTGSGWRMTTNVQPVIPIALNKDWNLISRTVAPIIHQGNVTAPGQSQTGLGDIVQSIFFSPNKTEPFIWGLGPAVMVPTATNSAFASKQLGFGPTAVVLKQQQGWTVGALWNHIWRVAGGSGRAKVNSDFIQPFLAYSTKDGWTYTANTESTYDWTGDAWSVPIHFQITKVVRFGKQPVSLGGGIRCWATSPTGGAEGCGLRIIVTGIFPKK